MKAGFRIATTAFCAVLTSLAFAGLSPQNVAVVVNGDSWASLTIANEYSRVRKIPASNFIVLKGLTSFEITDAERFRTEILRPVFAELKSRGILNQIDCISYSVDIPYAVQVSGDMAGKNFPQIITPTASTNGLTYLHQLVDQKDTEYLSLTVNRYNRRLLPLPKGAKLNAQELENYAKGVKLYDQKKYPEAIALIAPLLSTDRADPNIAYNLACCYSLAGKQEDAIAALRKAVDAGWRNYGQTASDPDLKPLASREDFQAILRLLKLARVQLQPGTSFRSRTMWDESGAPSTSGPQYMLSTMLGVTLGRGNSVREVITSFERSKSADATSTKGTIYYPKNGDVRSTTREWGFVPASNELKQLGVNAIVEDGILPKDRQDVAGGMIGIADFDWTKSGSKMLPGAIVEHLTSLGGIITERGGQTPCTDFIRAGAAGSSGTVTEPYALQEKFPNPFMHVQYAKGLTLAESFYQSLWGPYQLLVIGDPLCRPWGKPLNISVASSAKGAAVKGRITIMPSCDRKDDVDHYELYVDGKYVTEGPIGRTLPFESTTVGDGSHMLAIVAVEKGDTQAKTTALLPIQVANKTAKVVTSMTNLPVAYGSLTTIKASCKGASSIKLLHLNRTVGEINGADGEVKLDTTLVGVGPVVLQAVATVGGQQVLGSPFTFTVTPGASVAPVPAKAGMVPGLNLSMPGKPSANIKDTMDVSFIGKLTGGNNQAFALVGYFTVTEQDLFQVQIRTNTKAHVEVSGKEIIYADTDKQRFAPILLEPGVHRLKISGSAPNGAFMDIRIGNRGCLKPEQSKFSSINE